jgi:uncharacterized BrkB/YihY/UPF0761 family membrane protein
MELGVVVGFVIVIWLFSHSKECIDDLEKGSWGKTNEYSAKALFVAIVIAMAGFLLLGEQ